MTHPVNKVTNDFKISLRRRVIATLQELDSVLRKGAQSGKRLRQLVCNSGCKLAKHGELGGLNSFFLGYTKLCLRAFALGNLVAKALVGRQEIGGPLRDLLLQAGIRLFEHGLRFQPLAYIAAA